MARFIGRLNIYPLLLVAALLALWQLAAVALPQLRFVLPAPSAIGATLIGQRHLLLEHALATLRVMLGGFGLALIVAFPTAWAMVLWRQLSRTLQPMLVVLKCIPMFALAPIMVIWFGWTLTALVVPTALMILVPLILSIYAGLAATPEHLLEFFELNKATAWQTFVKLRLPWAQPQIFGGLRIAAAFAGFGAVAGEWAGAQEGLGVLMLESRHNTELPTTFAALACLTGLSLSFYIAVLIAEKFRAFRWMVPGAILLAVAVWPSGAPAHTTRLVLDWLPNPNHVPVFVGIEKGFFADEGIDLELTRLRDPGDGIPLLTSGMADLAISYTPHTVKAMAEGADVTMIATLIPEPLNCIMYRKGEGIDRLEDLNGKSIGYCSGSRGPLVLSAILKDSHIVPAEVHNVSFDLVASLGAGLVDAVYGACWNIESAQLRAKGIETGWIPISEFGFPHYAALVFVARDDCYSERIQRVLRRSIDYATSHPTEAFKIYARTQKSKSQETLQWEYEAWKNTVKLMGPTEPPSDDVVDGLRDWYRRHQIIGSNA